MYIKRDVVCIIDNKTIMQQCYDFKIRKLVEGNRKLYVFTCFFIIVVVNIWFFLIRLYNLCFLRNILRKIPGTTTEFGWHVVGSHA